MILFVTQSYSAGGVISVLYETLTQWPAEDQRRLLLVYNKAHGGKDVFKQIPEINNKVEIEELPLWEYNHVRKFNTGNKLKRFWFKLCYKVSTITLFWSKVLYFRGKCIENNIEIVFSHNGGYPGGDLNRASMVGAKLAKVNRKLMIVHNLAAPLNWWKFPTGYISDRLVNWATDKIIVVSDACRQALKKERFFSKPLQVIYNGIAVEPNGKESEYVIDDRWAKRANRIAFVGELVPRKGVHVLIEAVSMLGCDFVLLLFGSEKQEYARKLRKMVQQLGIEEKVIFCGHDPLAKQKLQYVDLLVLPSLGYESFGMVILEAMYWKKPVIVTDIGGMKEIVINDVTGLVVPAGDKDALKKAIQKLLFDKKLAQNLGNEGYKRLCAQFSASRMVKDYYQLTINN